jgi:hypothetical protein
MNPDWIKRRRRRRRLPLSKRRLASVLDRPYDPTRRAAVRERQRRSRNRRARGRIVFNVEADEAAVVRTLVQSGRLSEDEALRRSSVERALSEMTRDWCDRWREKKRDA